MSTPLPETDVDSTMEVFANITTGQVECKWMVGTKECKLTMEVQEALDLAMHLCQSVSTLIKSVNGGGE